MDVLHVITNVTLTWSYNGFVENFIPSFVHNSPE